MNAAEMGRSCWIMWVGPQCNYSGLSTREAGGDFTAAGKEEGELRTSTKRRTVLKVEGEVLSGGMRGTRLWMLEGQEATLPCSLGAA